MDHRTSGNDLPRDGPPFELSASSVVEEGGAAAAASARLLAVVRELALELQPRKGARLEVTLDSDLDRDLALDSLGRAELLQRLDRAFRVRLPEQLISEAATPRDLLAGVLSANPKAVDLEMARAPAAALPEILEPTRATTLLGSSGPRSRPRCTTARPSLGERWRRARPRPRHRGASGSDSRWRDR